MQSSSSDIAAVQAGRVLGDLLGMGESGERVKAQQDKIALERDKIALQRDMLKAAKDDKMCELLLIRSLIPLFSARTRAKTPKFRRFL